jgi:hypothetical protein
VPPPTAETESTWAPRRFRAPREHAAILAEPDLSQCASLASETHSRCVASRINLQGRTLGQMRTWARQDCLTAAADHTAILRGAPVALPDSNAVLFSAGHQPALFHAGVWIKNFAMGALAARTGGVGLNLVVDNDTLSSTGIRVPAGTAESPRYETILFDAPRAAQPWEDAVVEDRTLFGTFGQRVTDAMRPWGERPTIEEAWPDAVAFAEGSRNLPDCLTAVRHRQEVRWGVRNLELPVRRMCEQPSFLWFAAHILAQLPRFREIHNAVLWEYRRVNKVRSSSHPVPELADRDGWLEAPFWAWRAGEQRRRHVFARQLGKTLELSDGDTTFAALRLSPDMDACCAVEGLQQLPAQAWRFRTRALTTTIFARLCLSDLFIHGIGGAKYDEITDRILERFYGISPPPFLTLTATLHLPLGELSPVSPSDVPRLRQVLHDLDFNPDRHVADAPDILLKRKRSLIVEWTAAHTDGLAYRERRARRASRRERHLQFKEVRDQLAPLASAERKRRTQDLADVERRLAAQAVLNDREYAWCLHPAENLQVLMQRLAEILNEPRS